jgi:phage-related protein
MQQHIPDGLHRAIADVVYVLHAFQKKAKKGIATPSQDIELVKSRLRDAELHYRGSIENGGHKP